MPAPRRLYHASPARRRASIATHGLDPAYGAARRRGSGTLAVWTTSVRADALAGAEDIWQLDARGLRVEQHPGEDTWWLIVEPVGPERLRLLRSCD